MPALFMCAALNVCTFWVSSLLLDRPSARRDTGMVVRFDRTMPGTRRFFLRIRQVPRPAVLPPFERAASMHFECILLRRRFLQTLCLLAITSATIFLAETVSLAATPQGENWPQ